MKLIDFISCFDMTGAPEVRIWHIDDDNAPVFEGGLMDTPYWILDCELDHSGNMKAVYSDIITNEFGVNLARLIINVRG